MSKDVSIILPVQVSTLGTALPYVRMSEATRTRRLWSGQSLGLETHSVFAALAGTGHDLQFGSSVTLMPLQHPFTAAVTARSISEMSRRPYIAGVGPGAVNMQRVTLGSPYPKQLAAVREYVGIMRTLLQGHPAHSDGIWPVQGMELAPLPGAAVEIGLGVLRPRMARLAGEIADWAITWLTPVDYIGGELTECLDAGAERAERNRPRIASVLHCVLDRPGRDTAGAAATAVGAHVSAPHYVDMLRTAGITFGSPDPSSRAQTLCQHGVIAAGTPDDIADEVRRYHAAGVDEVVLNLGGVFMTEGPGSAARDLHCILDAIGDV